MIKQIIFYAVALVLLALWVWLFIAQPNTLTILPNTMVGLWQ